MMKNPELAELNAELQRIVGATVSSNIEILLQGSESPDGNLSGKTDGKSSEIAEQVTEKVLQAIYPQRHHLRHPRGPQSFPDYRVDQQDFEVKSWSSKSRRWAGPKLSLFQAALEENDPIYLQAVYIDFNIQRSEGDPGEYLLESVRAGRLWDFCEGGLMGSPESLKLSPGGSQSPGVPLETFARNLCSAAGRRGWKLDHGAILNLGDEG